MPSPFFINSSSKITKSIFFKLLNEYLKVTWQGIRND